MLSLSPKHAPADVVRELKSRSSGWLRRERARTHRGFAWQEGYSIFTVSRTGREKVLKYIADQDACHQRKSFETEVVGLLKKHSIPYDARFVLG